IDAQLVGDLARRGRANAMNVSQRDDHALVGREVNPCNTSQKTSPCSTGVGFRAEAPLSHRGLNRQLRDLPLQTARMDRLLACLPNGPQLSIERRAYGESDAPSTVKRADAHIGSEAGPVNASEAGQLHQNGRVVKS